MSFCLVTQPWIPVLTTAGVATRSLADVFAPDVVAVASGSDLENTAITRLLLAVQIAADRAGAHPGAWLHTHRQRFDLFDPEQPFWQNPDMARFLALPGAVRPIIGASYRHTGRSSAAVNLWHTASDVRHSHAQAARLLVVRQQFSVGGVQAFTAAAYGKAPMSAKASVATNRPLLWLDTGTLAGSLASTAQLSADRPAGTFWFSWPSGAQPAQYGQPTGVLDGLTWPSRSMLLTGISDDSVGEIMICDGLRWPEPAADADYTPQRQADLVPYTIYARKKPTDPYTPQTVHPNRPIWRQLATMCADPDNPASPWQHHAAELQGSWRLGGLASYQSGIAGPLSGAFPAPRDRTALAAFLAALVEGYSRIGWTARSMAEAVSGAGGYVEAIPPATALGALAAPLAEDLAAGVIELDAALESLTAAVTDCADLAYRAVARVRPLVAGRTAARSETTQTRAAFAARRKG
ncbi:type I-E CRISPR-associated protein Cse1/CasA [Mycobacterium hubeiense]|uniref:type I-E CRISPR-associated protein Cse1/CasA n=1 Tax=Mycobacterium hubeiense TaxID=1867256 RepID=UPI000C7EFB54|nr:type I-E CRISPR-associated protein Cse1/CasA [Mycobacterium sp. QGD 101]